jgi:UDP-N-acetylglucosamine 2-epimerase (non-hydrolysing)
MIVIVAGARPNLMKIAPISKVFKENGVEHKIWYSGQHYDKNLYIDIKEQLGIEIDQSLDLTSYGNVIKDIQKILESFKSYLESLSLFKIEGVIVVGDVNTTYACALVTKRLGIPLIHVEAGLRSFDDSMPEEKNRITVDHVSDILFASCQDAVDNLRDEGIVDDVYLVGNVMIDCLKNCQEIINSSLVKIPEVPYIVVTFHRPENVDNKENLKKIFSKLNYLSTKYEIVFPMHPRTKKKLEEFDIGFSSNLYVIEPLGYIDFMKLVSKASFVITDSGGIQEELCYLEIPCFTIRKNTERPITIDLGTNTLVGINNLADDIFEEPLKRKPFNIPFWDGEASKRILKILQKENIC